MRVELDSETIWLSSVKQAGKMHLICSVSSVLAANTLWWHFRLQHMVLIMGDLAKYWEVKCTPSWISNTFRRTSSQQLLVLKYILFPALHFSYSSNWVQEHRILAQTMSNSSKEETLQHLWLFHPKHGEWQTGGGDGIQMMSLAVH